MKWTDLRTERKSAGIRTQTDLAKACGPGYTPEMIAAIENGLVGIDRETQERIRETIKQVQGEREMAAA